MMCETWSNPLRLFIIFIIVSPSNHLTKDDCRCLPLASSNNAPCSKSISRRSYIKIAGSSRTSPSVASLTWLGTDGRAAPRFRSGHLKDSFVNSHGFVWFHVDGNI